MEPFISSTPSAKDRRTNPSDPPAVLITGASGGIGRAISQAFGKIGWYVGVHYYRNKPAAEMTLDRVLESGGIGDSYHADIREAESVRRMIDRFSGCTSGPLTLVCNAGIGQSDLLVRHSDEIWDNVIATNLTGTFHCLRAMAPSLLARGGGLHHSDRVPHGIPRGDRPECICDIEGRTDRTRQNRRARMGAAEYSRESRVARLAEDRPDQGALSRRTRLARSRTAPSSRSRRSRRYDRACCPAQGRIRADMEL